MIRKHKKTLVLTSLLTLLPMLVGVLLWDRLPERMATHWGVDGQPDGWSSMAVAVFGFPLLMVAMQWFCAWITSLDKGNKNANKKVQKVVLWIVPAISNLCCGMMYALALGAEISVNNLMVPVLGVMFVVFGNYMPKCKMNSTIGIKIYWTYTSEENWNATHRFAGRVWVIGGLVIALCGLIPGDWTMGIMLIGLLLLAVLPMVYSYRFYRRQLQRGDSLRSVPPVVGKSGKIVTVFLVVLLIVLAVILFAGSVDVEFGQTSFTVDSTFHSALTVEYDAIDSLEYREGNVDGVRVGGFGSLRLLLGLFENEEFGSYTRYTYYNPDACLILTAGERVLVISGEDAASTRELYEQLLARTK